jgi:hypothetical protein
MWQFCDDLQATNSSVWPSQSTIAPLQATVQRQAESLIHYIRLPGSHAATGQDEAARCIIVIRALLFTCGKCLPVTGKYNLMLHV